MNEYNGDDNLVLHIGGGLHCLTLCQFKIPLQWSVSKMPFSPCLFSFLCLIQSFCLSSAGNLKHVTAVKLKTQNINTVVQPSKNKSTVRGGNMVSTLFLHHPWKSLIGFDIVIHLDWCKCRSWAYDFKDDSFLKLTVKEQTRLKYKALS